MSNATTPDGSGFPGDLAAALADHYRLERLLGAGGMALVYLAEDRKHHRRVAVKVLQAELSHTLGTERFLREIELVAALQHPHIVPLIDSGAAAGTLYFVMPYVDGESLRARLHRDHRLPIAEVIRIIADVADALAYAHAHGVVHRDIKPDNIMLSGRHALVMDFGVAKALALGLSAGESAVGPSTTLTGGLALGTPAYMAPEQATASPDLDHRVDLYALGAVAYEMLSGSQLFQGRTPQQVLVAQVLDTPEPITELRADTPPALAALIERCLAKTPAERWASADEMLAALGPLDTPSGGLAPGPSARASRRTRMALLAGGAALVALGAWGLPRVLHAPPQLVLERQVRATLDPGLELDPALSPDGKLIAYAAGPPGRTQIFLRQVGGGNPVPVLRDTTDAFRRPQWSPDGARLLVRTRGGFEILPALGGPRRVLVTGRQGRLVGDATWSPDGDRIAYTIGDSLFLRPVDAGGATGIAQIPELYGLSWSPDGRWIAGVSGNLEFMYDARDFGNVAPSQVVLVPLAGGAAIPVTDSLYLNASPVWRSPTELLLISSRGGRRDLYRLRLGRNGHPDGPLTRVTTGLDLQQITLGENGTSLGYSELTETVNIWAIDVSGPGRRSLAQARPITDQNQVIESFDLSPDGNWLVFDSDREGHQHLFRRRLAGGETEQLTTGEDDDFYPRWSPTGNEIAYHTFRDGNREIFTLSLDSRRLTRVTTRPEHDQTPAWGPDDSTLVFQTGFGSELNGQTRLAIVQRSRDGWGQPRDLAPDCRRPAWSPDHQLISCISADGALRVMPSGGGPGRILVAADSGGRGRRVELAVWAADGRSLWYEAFEPEGSSGIWSVPVTGGTPVERVSLDDATRQATRYGMVAQGQVIYLTLGVRQADLWVGKLGER